MPIYMNWGNSVPPRIRGDVTAASHVGWIELFSVQAGVQRAIPTPTGKSRQPETGLTRYDLVISKATDSSSAPLHRATVLLENTTVLIDFVKIDRGKPVVVMQYKLTDTLISGYSMCGGVRPMESLSLNFGKLEWGQGQGVTPHMTVPPRW